MATENTDLITEAMAHRYLYYVLLSPVISDREYDILEHAAVEIAPEDSPIHDPGSSLESSYSWPIKNRARQLLAERNLP